MLFILILMIPVVHLALHPDHQDHPAQAAALLMWPQRIMCLCLMLMLIGEKMLQKWKDVCKLRRRVCNIRSTQLNGGQQKQPIWISLYIPLIHTKGIWHQTRNWPHLAIILARVDIDAYDFFFFYIADSSSGCMLLWMQHKRAAPDQHFNCGWYQHEVVHSSQDLRQSAQEPRGQCNEQHAVCDS